MDHLVNNYPRAALWSGMVVDVGGSVGGTAFAIASAFADLHIIVQDLPNTIAAAQDESGLKVKFMARDFFTEQPVKGADLYMFRLVLHDFPDKYCVQMLRQFISALKPGAGLLLSDVVMPDPGTWSNIDERWQRLVFTLHALIPRWDATNIA